MLGHERHIFPSLLHVNSYKTNHGSQPVMLVVLKCQKHLTDIQAFTAQGLTSWLLSLLRGSCGVAVSLVREMTRSIFVM